MPIGHLYIHSSSHLLIAWQDPLKIGDVLSLRLLSFWCSFLRTLALLVSLFSKLCLLHFGVLGFTWFLSLHCILEVLSRQEAGTVVAHLICFSNIGICSPLLPDFQGLVYVSFIYSLKVLVVSHGKGKSGPSTLLLSWCKTLSSFFFFFKEIYWGNIA